ncbi:V-type ATP synthase subunit A [Nocardioides islandensis]|uniref:V-type ATP synthase subunit A n=1 Tax=Nocardioides islandensis TaxID=433663 RepID=A0A930VH78_9ACTN|nr:V-type ATP synthase subunit A [Nocardioides islandensis]MBF4764512.1 V-type ATP synthase subunit A [Nocardioides islandensis]
MSAATATTGTIARVSGPLVEVEGLAGVAMFDVVDLGPRELPGEVVSIRDGVLTVQAYEYTGGLRPGHPARARGEPLSVPLGPGLLGHVFDGLLRPLSGMPAFLPPRPVGGGTTPGEWHFEAAADPGARLAEGDRLGTVDPHGAMPLPILVPPHVSGELTWVAGSGTYAADAVVARVGDTDVALTQRWPVRLPRPYRSRGYDARPLHTGQRVVDLLFPVARGSAVGVPGGFGTGKTVLLQQIAKWCDADVIVYVGCGERGNEMAEVVSELSELRDPRTGGPLAERTVVIANTSNMPMMARESSVYTGMTVAEYFRDQGRHVVLIADSTSRWAEALRELASRTGTMPAEEGYPADLASSLAAFYERAGEVTTLGGTVGSVTVIGAVSPPGGDLTEPVTSQTERFVRCLWSLDHDLAYARHYPALSWTGSFSRDADMLGGWFIHHGDPEWARRRARMSGLLAEADRLTSLAELVGAGTLPGHERVVMLAGRLLRLVVLQQNALSPNDVTCGPAKGAALGDAVLAVVDQCERLVESGVPATAVEEVDFGPLVRARSDTGADDAEGVNALLDEVLKRLAQLT